MGILSIRDLNVSFGKNQILKNINLDIKKGEFLTIIGPNGCGKTTLLKSISKLISVEKKSIFIENKDISSIKIKEMAKIISAVPQNTDVTYEFTCYDVVMMGRYPYVNRLKGESKDDIDIVEYAMDMTNVMHLKNRLFTAVSGGERQRVVLAQAIAQDPEIILLDEPISNLDPQYQVEILDVIKKLSIEKNLTVVAVLHDLNFTSMYSDKIVLMKKGSIFKTGDADEVLTKENIKQVFDTEVLVSKSPVVNKPHIYQKTKGFFEKTKSNIHIICGGGSGSDLIHELHHRGYILNTCVLNHGDMDWNTAKECKIKFVEEDPFNKITKKSYLNNLENIKQSNAVIICPTYFSNMNILNLEVLNEPEILDKEIYIIIDGDYKTRDFTEGVASKLIEKIMKRNTCKICKGSFLDEFES